MSDYKNKYRELYGDRNNLRDNYANSMKRKVSDFFYDSPSYYQVYINSSPTPSDVWIVDDSKTKELKQIQTKPDSGVLAIGDLVNWNGTNWLVQIVDDMAGIYFRGSIQQCNSTFPIITNKTRVLIGTDAEGRPIYEDQYGAPTNVPCIVETKSFTTVDNQQLPLPEGRINVTIQYQTAENLKIDETFAMYGNTYKITDIDYTKVLQNKGVLTLHCQRVVTQP